MAAMAQEEGKLLREKQRVYRLGRRQGVWRGGRLGMEEGVREEEEEEEEEEGGHKAEKKYSTCSSEEGGGEGEGEGEREGGRVKMAKPRKIYPRQRWRRPIDEREYWRRVERVWSMGRLPQYQDDSASWKLWILQPSVWFKNHSLLLQSLETGDYILIDAATTNSSFKLSPQLFFPSAPPYNARWFVGIELENITISAAFLFQQALETFSFYVSTTPESHRDCLGYLDLLAQKLQCVGSQWALAVIPPPATQTWV